MKEPNPDQSCPVVASEVRTRRLVVVDKEGVERAIIEVDKETVELRLGGMGSEIPCEVMLFAGEQESGLFRAGLELWADGNSFAGCNVTVSGSRVRVEWFGEGEPLDPSCSD